LSHEMIDFVCKENTLVCKIVAQGRNNLIAYQIKWQNQNSLMPAGCFGNVSHIV